MVQGILFPEGIFYDKENDAYRTSGMNEVIGLIAELSGAYQKEPYRTYLFKIYTNSRISRVLY